MTSSNRVRLTGVAEATFGVTPGTPRMRMQRVTSIGLTNKTDYVDSDEIRSDRMNADPIPVGETNDGNIGIEWHFPPAGSLLRSEIQSAFCAAFSDTPSRDNDGVADSVITDIGTTANAITFASGPAFVVRHLVLNTGFAVTANNGLFPVTTGGTTSLVSTGAFTTPETAPPANARVKVVGFQGVSGDITATATGLGSTTLDFTTLGLTVGQWVKIGGTGSGFRFATSACNAWARVAGILANALTLDNLPAAWTTDSGTSKTIRVFFGDVIKNGTGKYGLTVERGYMGQTVPTYIAQNGMRVGTLEFGGQKKAKATGSISFMGMEGLVSTTSLDSSPDAAPALADYPVMAFSAHCGRVGYGGSALGSPNWVSAIKFTLNNNLRAIEAVSDGDSTAPGPVDVEDGSLDVSVELDTYFGNSAILADIKAGTARAVNTRLFRGGRAMIWEAPRLTPREGDPTVGGKNQDVMLPVRATASYDALTGAQIILNLLEYAEE